MASSKTARRSTPTGPAGKFQPDAQSSRIVPLGGGSGAYVFNADGKMHRFDVASDAFIAALVEYANALGIDRVKRDLDAANRPEWADVPARLEAALAPAEAAAE
jgi:hypothetical protein